MKKALYFYKICRFCDEFRKNEVNNKKTFANYKDMCYNGLWKIIVFSFGGKKCLIPKYL